MLVLPPGQRRLSGLVPSKEQRGRFRKGPGEVRGPNLVPRSAPAFAPGCFRTLDESTIRREILPTWEAIDRVNFVAQDKTEDWAKARHGLSEVKGMGRVFLSRFDDQAFEVA
jgi:hypothetical protein